MKEPIINPIKLLMKDKADLFKSLQKEIFNAIPNECISTSTDTSYKKRYPLA